MKELLILIMCATCIGIGWAAGSIWSGIEDLARTAAEVWRLQWRALVRDHIIDDEPEDA